MRRIGVLLIALMVCGGLFAKKNKKATEILDAVITKTKAQKTIKANFTFIMKNVSEDIYESKSGIIQIMGNSYRLTMDRMIVISNGKTSWNLLLDEEEVMINNVETGDENSITPTNLLNAYNENYKSKLIEEYYYKGKDIQLICLTPLKGKKISIIHIEIDKKEKQVVSFSIFHKDGNVFSYEINNYILNKDIPISNFIFNEDEYPNFEVVDMR
jgi:outer membrane lipoprotein-sorting protein